MTFTDFLAALAQALDAPPEPGAPARALPRALYDPRHGAPAALDEVLVGLGQWQRPDGTPIDHPGVCLNHKGTAERFGPACRYDSLTGFVLAPPDPLVRHWERVTARCDGPGDLLRRFTLIVEDGGPDSCLALLCWLARCSGVTPADLTAGLPAVWLQVVHRWETTGMADDPAGAWVVLLSALGHSYVPGVDPGPEADPPDFSQGWREALRYTVALLRRGIDPTAVPRLPGLSGDVRARIFLEVERQEYLQSLPQASLLQLWVPLAGSRGRRLLVDAYFASEDAPSGARKLLIRRDCEHSHLRQGFALMGLHRPGECGGGGDMTLSVNPETGIELRLLWTELERLETERWAGQRPRNDPRDIVSYPDKSGYNQPWWDDNGRYTLLGAPKALPRPWRSAGFVPSSAPAGGSRRPRTICTAG